MIVAAIRTTPPQIIPMKSGDLKLILFFFLMSVGAAMFEPIVVPISGVVGAGVELIVAAGIGSGIGVVAGAGVVTGSEIGSGVVIGVAAAIGVDPGVTIGS